ncbi:MAG: outer membrane lipid asymmetry maintenance protein MlaD [Proteobacteria bacterium]|nr:outer membrane lipid asymmetry maintenance protein MlaD [Pseudomonadota bacterium]MDE3207678.1 outer membrane lipid asymmetry maintenance protein MlaD [Pseudomonadota bacterium]
MERSTYDLWVGLFVVAGLVALLALAFKAGNLGASSIGSSYVVKANFDDVGGLKVRAPVKASGVVVGRVTSIRFDPVRYQAQVTMKIGDAYRFPRDTTASILTSGLLGDQYVGLDAGGDSVMLKNGDTIHLTQSAIVIEKLIGQFLFNKASGGGKSPSSSTAKAGGL